jgi:FkbH-like protein
MKLIEALQIANAADSGPPFRVLLACGFTPLHLETAVKARLRLALPGRSIAVRTGLYGDLAGTLESPGEACDAVLVALEWGDLDPRLAWRSAGKVSEELLADARARLERIAKAIAALAARTPVALSLPTVPLAPVLHTSGEQLDAMEAALWEMLHAFAVSTSVAVLHPRLAARQSGHDLKMELMSGFPYTFAHADALAAALVRLLFPPAPKKGLITDLDETLWSGVLGDDGPEAISWDLEHKTQFHGLYQQVLNVLAEAGILLAVASKNDPALTAQALTRADLVVKREHLFPIEAHWRAKLESVERILRVWNVGAESVVFVDDNPLELEHARAAFPEMECVQFRNDDAAFLLELRERFAKRAIREEDRLRVASLRAGEALRQAAAQGASLDALLAGAQSRITFRWGKEPDPRALELVNKTNQFNLNGARYTQADWNAYLAVPATYQLVVEYEDRFGKLGKIAVLAGREQAGAFEVDVWVMSCRAFARRIEHQCLSLLLSRWEPVRLRYQRTERNGPMREFLAEMAPEGEALGRAAFARRCPPLYHEAAPASV